MEGEYILFVHEDVRTVGKTAEEIQQEIINLRLEGYKDQDISAFIYESGERDVDYYWEEGEEVALGDFFY